MSAFTEKEIEYLRERRLGRLATVNGKGEPHVVPVAFRYNEELDVIDIGGHNFAKTKKYRDARRTGRAAFVVDDVLPPWRGVGCGGAPRRSGKNRSVLASTGTWSGSSHSASWNGAWTPTPTGQTAGM